MEGKKHGGIIIQQLKKVGASCDWSRERFTMDLKWSRCVQKVFVELYKKGHYLSRRAHGELGPVFVSLTALSDEEVILERAKRIFLLFQSGGGGSAGNIFDAIATTRPETIPGDTAVAVKPERHALCASHWKACRAAVAGGIATRAKAHSHHWR